MIEISLKEKIAGHFIAYCNKKHYQYDCSTEQHAIRIDIASLTEKTIVSIYNTGSIVMGGPKNSLKSEVASLIEEIKQAPAILESKKYCSAKYNLIKRELQEKIKNILNSNFSGELIDHPKNDIEYRLRINKDGYSITIQQFANGTLLLQGKTDILFDEVCDFIEKNAILDEKEIISRFISGDQGSLDAFVVKYTPELLPKAEANVKNKIGIKLFTYLNDFDKKWLIASECLLLVNIPLPEFSPIVMPSAKAFEGFAKKLLVDIGLFSPTHFDDKKANFSNLMDKNHPNRVTLCSLHKYADSHLKRIESDLDFCRNFLMHSDDSAVTKIESFQEAEQEFKKIIEEMRLIFDFFDKGGFL